MQFRKTIMMRAAALSLVLCAASTAFAEDKEENPQPKTRMEYKFPQLTTPKGLTRCSLAIYGYDDHSAFTCRKDPLCELGKKRFIQDININPSGVNFIVISKEKDKNSATVYDLGNFDTELFKLKTKKLGNPTAVLFTPDARRVILATSTGIHILDAKQFEEIESFEIPFTPTEILLSNNERIEGE